MPTAKTICAEFEVCLLRLKDHFKGGSRILKWGVNFCNNVREIKYYFNIRGIWKKKKERRGLRKRGVKIHPFHLPWIRAWGRLFFRYLCVPWWCFQIRDEQHLVLQALWYSGGHCLVKLSFLHFIYTRMFPAAWENTRFLKEDIVIKGYRIPPNVSQSNNWIS